MAEEPAKKKMGRPKQDVVKDKLVCIVMNDVEMARFEYLEQVLTTTKSEIMRRAFEEVESPKSKKIRAKKTHQIGVWLTPTESEKIDKIRKRIQTSKGGVFKYGLDLLYERIHDNPEE